MDFSLISVPAQSRITLSLTFGMITEYTPDEHYTTHERWSIIFVNGGGFIKYSPSNNIVSRLYCVCIGSLSNVLNVKYMYPCLAFTFDTLFCIALSYLCCPHG